jgi:hypothetical protein
LAIHVRPPARRTMSLGACSVTPRSGGR